MGGRNSIWQLLPQTWCPTFPSSGPTIHSYEKSYQHLRTTHSPNPVFRVQKKRANAVGTLVSSETAGPTSAREEVKGSKSPHCLKRRREGERSVVSTGLGGQVGGRAFRGGAWCGLGPPRCSIFTREVELGDCVRPIRSRSVSLVSRHSRWGRCQNGKISHHG